MLHADASATRDDLPGVPDEGAARRTQLPAPARVRGRRPRSRPAAEPGGQDGWALTGGSRPTWARVPEGGAPAGTPAVATPTGRAASVRHRARNRPLLGERHRPVGAAEREEDVRVGRHQGQVVADQDDREAPVGP